MIMTAELSLYPLREGYVEPIEVFISRLRRCDKLTTQTNAMSTQIQGESEQVFNAVREALEASGEQFGDQVLVCKFIPKALSL